MGRSVMDTGERRYDEDIFIKKEIRHDETSN